MKEDDKAKWWKDDEVITAEGIGLVVWIGAGVTSVFFPRPHKEWIIENKKLRKINALDVVMDIAFLFKKGIDVSHYGW